MAKAKVTRKAAEETGLDRLLASLKEIDAMMAPSFAGNLRGIAERESERERPMDTEVEANMGVDDPFDFGTA